MHSQVHMSTAELKWTCPHGTEGWPSAVKQTTLWTRVPPVPWSKVWSPFQMSNMKHTKMSTHVSEAVSLLQKVRTCVRHRVETLGSALWSGKPFKDTPEQVGVSLSKPTLRTRLHGCKHRRLIWTNGNYQQEGLCTTKHGTRTWRTRNSPEHLLSGPVSNTEAAVSQRGQVRAPLGHGCETVSVHMKTKLVKQ